ncbi:hypothetical protein SKAU_G00136150 [Synaphobranchus kaupii]|uniref:Uncharacterized protein n=1 Tax=Synaphobranchus kaupii TaxID=118154 RepID=A0A9Q1FRR1_SYNKA|nr:hypothetical protein SKAU_G00136150 [Synaphobranchus kaupii]
MLLYRARLGWEWLGAARMTGSLARRHITYTQGQSPEPRIREYFYYIDHQGQVLFLDDTKMKNFITCFKDKQFLSFFFSRVRGNESGRYQEHFPFLSLCGRERNFLRCEDRPLVFTHLLPGPPESLSFCGGGDKLVVPFSPISFFMHPSSGRLYHPCPERAGYVGLVRSALAFELSPCFEYPPGRGPTGQPTHFLWAGQRHKLTNELARHFPEEGEGQVEGS